MLVKDTDYFATAETSQRFDLIRHLIENSEIVPLVRGPCGIGKSQLAARIKRLAPENWSVSLIEANPKLSPEQLLAGIARSTGWTDPQDDLLQGLVNRFESMREQGRIPVILVDEAQLLAPTGLMTLLRLFERQLAGAPLVSLVLFADEQIDMLLSTPQLRLMSPQAIQVIDLPPMSRQDATSYMHFLLQVEGLSTDLELNATKLNRLFKETGGIPGPLRQEILNAFGRQGEAKVQGQERASVRRFVLSLPPLIVIGGLLLYQDEINQFLMHSPPQQDPVEDTSGDELVGIEEVGRFRAAMDDEEVAQAQPKTDLMQADSDIPREIGQESTNLPLQEIVEFQAPLLEFTKDLPVDVEKHEEFPEEAVGQLDEDLKHEPVAVVTQSDTKNELEEPVPEAEQSPTASASTPEDIGPLLDQAVTGETEPPVDPLRKDAWVKSRPAELYTLQLLAVENLESLDRFVSRHNLRSEVFYLTTQREGRPWYPLFWGDFSDKVRAIKAQAELPPVVRDSGVWARPFGDLHKLLD